MTELVQDGLLGEGESARYVGVLVKRGLVAGRVGVRHTRNGWLVFLENSRRHRDEPLAVFDTEEEARGWARRKVGLD